MASHTMIRRCLLKCLLLVVLVECYATTTPTVRPDEKSNEALVPYILGLPETVARALDRIHRSTRNYRLMDDIWFEVVPENAGVDRKKSASKSPPKNLVERADAIFDTHRLSWHNALMQGLDLNIYKDQMQKYTFNIIKRTQNPYDFNIQGTRTFGAHRRRMQFVMLPIMYKLGVITTLLIGLTVLSVKGVTIGVLLLVLAVAGVVAKLSKYHHQPVYGPYVGAAYAHDPYDRAASAHQLQQAPASSHEKNIHVHVHAAPGAAPPYGHHAMLKGGSSLAYGGSSLAYGGQAPAAADDSADGPYYWNRHADDYYDAAADNGKGYHPHNRRRDNGDAVESTTENSVYPWLG